MKYDIVSCAWLTLADGRVLFGYAYLVYGVRISSDSNDSKHDTCSERTPVPGMVRATAYLLSQTLCRPARIPCDAGAFPTSTRVPLETSKLHETIVVAFEEHVHARLHAVHERT